MTKRKLKVVDATKPFSFHLTKEIVEEAYRLGLNGRQLMSLAIMRTSAPDAPVVVRGKLGTGRMINGKIEIGGPSLLSD